MKVILKDKVKALGNIGEVVNVSNGYARNFLFPRQLAVLADEKNSKALESAKKILAKKMAEQEKIALEAKKKIEALKLELTKKVGANGKLFGTITNTELAQVLNGKGIEVERRQIVITNPIKQLGESEATIKLFSDVSATLKVNVVMDEAQAVEMQRKQKEAEARAKAKKEAKKNEKTEEAEAEVKAEEAE